MQTLNEWMVEHEKLCSRSRADGDKIWQDYALQTALKIIRDLAERCGWADAEHAAEQIINAKEQDEH